MENYSKDNLINLLEEIKKAIVENKLPTSTEEHLWSMLTFDNNDPYYKEMIKYLFTGWLIYNVNK